MIGRTLSAVATDNLGATATNSVSIVADAPPTVRLTSPTNNASFTAGADITLQATASDNDGNVSMVEFLSGTTLLGMATNSPYTFKWNSVLAGNYSLTAKATDNLDALTTSSPVNISVANSTATAVTLINPVWNGSGFSFSFATVSSSTYTVQYTDSLNPISWQSMTNFAGNGTTVSVTNITTATQRFYRVETQ